jgi:hypothetical protein
MTSPYQEWNMKRFLGGFALVALILGLSSEAASAQMHGLPVYGAVGGVGVTLMGDFGRGLNDDSDKSNYFGGRIELGLPMVNLYAGAGTVKPEGDLAESSITFGGGAHVKLLKGPDAPVGVGVQAGLGYLSEDGATFMRVPFGVVLAFNVPSTGVAVTPWIAPRAEWQRISVEGFDSESKIGFGASGGLSIVLPVGLDFHAALDWMTIEFVEGFSFKPLVVGVGASYHITVPSLGM